MGSLLDHIRRRELGRVAESWDWMPVTSFVPREAVDMVYATRYRLELRSGVEYMIHPPDIASDIHPAHRHARQQLVRHIYQDQIEIGRKLYSALYGSASRQDIVQIVNELMESMSYDGY